MARILSAFIVRAETTSNMMQSEIERGREPIGEVLVELARDGSMTLRLW